MVSGCHCQVDQYVLLLLFLTYIHALIHARVRVWSLLRPVRHHRHFHKQQLVFENIEKQVSA